MSVIVCRPRRTHFEIRFDRSFETRSRIVSATEHNVSNGTSSATLESHLQLFLPPCPPDIAPGRAERDGLWPLNRSPSASLLAIGSMR